MMVKDVPNRFNDRYCANDVDVYVRDKPQLRVAYRWRRPGD